MAHPLAPLVALVRAIVFRIARLLSEALLLTGLVDPRWAKSRTVSLADVQPRSDAEQAALLELSVSRAPALADPCRRSLHPIDLYPGARRLQQPWGHTHAWLFGDESSDKRIVFVHGLTIPSVVCASLRSRLCG